MDLGYGRLIELGIICLIIVGAILRGFINLVDDKQRDYLFFVVFILAPVWIALFIQHISYGLHLLVQPISGWTLITVGLNCIEIAAFGLFYIDLTVNAAESGQSIGIIITAFFTRQTGRKASLHSKLDVLIWQRRLIYTFLMSALLLIVVSIVWIGNNLLTRNPDIVDKQTLAFGVGVIIVFITYVCGEIWRKSHFSPPPITSARQSEIDSQVANLAVATGCPQLKTYIFDNAEPTLFSLHPFGEKPVIYMTSAFLRLADTRELEAGLAHQYAQIVHGVPQSFEIIELLLTIIRVFSFLLAFFAIVVLNVPLYLSFVFVAMYIIFYLNDLGKELQIDLKINVRASVEFLNPIYVFINVILYSLLYEYAANAILTADLEALGITRFPQGAYSLLRKIDSAATNKQPMPSAYYYLYYTAASIDSNKPPTQPPIKERLELIEELDHSVVTTAIRTIPDIECPVCQSAMHQLTIRNKFNFLFDFDLCKQCGSIWFDKGEVNDLQDITKNDIDLKELHNALQDAKSFDFNQPYMCPRCNQQLTAEEFAVDPIRLRLLRCKQCQGYLLDKDTWFTYYTYLTTAKAKGHHYNQVQKLSI